MLTDKISSVKARTMLALLVFAPGLSAQAYTLKATPKTVAWGYYDAKATPALRVKSGDTAEIQTPASEPAQEEKGLVVYVKHVEMPMPYYPPLARQTRVGATVVMNLKIAADGRVQGVEFSSGESNAPKMLELFKSAAKNIIKTWTFGCTGCPPSAPFEHTITFIYKVENEITASRLLVMNLPDEVTMTTDAAVIQTLNNSKKGSQ